MNDFAERLQYLMDVKKTNQQAVADGASVHRSRVSAWLNKKTSEPRRETLQKLSSFFKCDIEWLAFGSGDPFPPPKLETAEQNNSFDERCETSEGEDLTISDRDFKNLCAASFDPVFQFIAEAYGKDSIGIANFLDDLRDVHHPYRIWRHEKKLERKSSEPVDGNGKVAANNKK